MLKYNLKSLSSISSFFKYRNDIDIYTEDNAVDKEFYRTIFSRLLDGKMVINDITPLGPKTAVIKEFERMKNDYSRKRLYIVDGDLESINNTNCPNEKGFYVLPAYCIENFIIDEIAGVELVYFNRGSIDREIIKNDVDFENWLNSFSSSLISLFINLALLRKIGGGPIIKNAQSFIINQNGNAVVDHLKVNDYVQELKEEILIQLENCGEANPKQRYDFEIAAYNAKWYVCNENLLTIVSGKNYLLPLYNLHLRRCSGMGNALFPTKSYKLFLANHCNLDRLTGLRDAILN